MSDELLEQTDEEILEETDGEGEPTDPNAPVIVFRGDLFNCRERLNVLIEEEFTAEIFAMDAEEQAEGAPPLFEVVIPFVELEEAAKLFRELWQEGLSKEGFDDEQIKIIEDGVVDLSQDSIMCPGCQQEITEITEEGECIECGLFLGFPEDDGESEDGEVVDEEVQE